MEILGKRKEFSMNKKFIIALILIIIASIVTTFAIIIYNLKSVQNIGSANETIENFQTTSPYTTVPTSYDEVKLSPNAILTFLKHYDGCGHTLKEKENISAEMANITKSEFLKLYSDWEIKDFSNTDVELYKIFSGNCGEHFLVKSSSDGFVEIYRIKDDGIYELHETTEIAIKYLSNDDRKELENGVILYGKENLNSYIENFE